MFNKIIASIFLSMIVAAATSAIAWLLDPAIKKIFLKKIKNLFLLFLWQ